MYNEYYLEQIYQRLGITNNSLIDEIENQEAMIQNQQTLISGDMLIKEQMEKNITISTMILLIVSVILIYHFIERCFRC